MTADSVAEVVRAHLARKMDVYLSLPECRELVTLVHDAEAVPSYVEPEDTERMPAATVAHAAALTRLPF